MILINKELASAIILKYGQMLMTLMEKLREELYL
jgi:hypothetical protein